MASLIVLIGAGASYDCAVYREGQFHRQPDGQWRPPLTSQLFDPRERFGSILDLYPGARSAAADIRVRLLHPAEGKAFALEEYLREELKASTSADARYRFRQIPLYLQHLLFEVGRNYTTEPENYARLVNAALSSELNHVVFITLNYDTILDRELFHRTSHGRMSSEPTDLLDYISDQERWTLIKLHGSVNWGRRVNLPDYLKEGLAKVSSGQVYVGWFDWLSDLIESGTSLNPNVELRLQKEISDRRRDPSTDALYYPALSVPIGPDPELGNCPRDHIHALRRRLTQIGEERMLLVVGYSGLDDEVLELLSEGGRVTKVAIVDVDPGRVHEQLAKTLGPFEAEYFDGGFRAWAQSVALDGYFSRFS